MPVLLCNFMCFANYCLIVASMVSLACISVERYIAIVHPFYHMTSKTTSDRCFLFMITWPWIQGCTFASVPSMLGWIHYDYWEAICAVDWFEQQPEALIFVGVAFPTCFLMPGLIMLYSYSCVLRVVSKSKARWPRELVGVNNNGNIKSATERFVIKTKTARTLLVVIILFFICMTPYCLSKLVKVITGDPDTVPGYINLSASYLCYISSAINPFIYAIFRPEFLSAYIRLRKKLPLQNWRFRPKKHRITTEYNSSSTMGASRIFSNGKKKTIKRKKTPHMEKKAPHKEKRAPHEETKDLHHEEIKDLHHGEKIVLDFPGGGELLLLPSSPTSSTCTAV